MARLLLLNGPNLNLLGERENPDLRRGHPATIIVSRSAPMLAGELGHELVRHSRAMPNTSSWSAVHARPSQEGIDFMILNPGAFTHTSIALRDAIARRGAPVHRSASVEHASRGKPSAITPISRTSRSAASSASAPMGYELALRRGAVRLAGTAPL
jgi:3-dehydroquinate dehydratase-2